MLQENSKKNQFFIRLLQCFILIQPLLDTYFFYANSKLKKLFFFSIPTLLRFGLIALIVFLFWKFSISESRSRYFKYICVYALILVFYSVGHLWYFSTFPAISKVMIIKEAFYIVRMLLPMIMIYIIYHTEFSIQQFMVVIQGLVALISGSIVISNLICKSMCSYDNHKLIVANIFSWFSRSDFTFREIASKGWFYFANTISAILVLLVPLIIYLLLTRFNFINSILYIITGMAMIMLGTRVGTLGFVAINILSILVYLVHIFILRNAKFSIKPLILIAIFVGAYCATIPYSPMSRRNQSTETVAKKSTKHHTKRLINKLDKVLSQKETKAEKKEYIIAFVKKYHNRFNIPKKYIKYSIPVENNYQFWNKIYHWPSIKRMDNRLLEETMVKEYMSQKSVGLVKIFGISYLAMTQLFHLERDFVSQKDSMGFIGMILLVGIYPIMIVYSIYKWLRYSQLRTMLNSFLIMANGLLILVAYNSGNVMDFLTASLIASFTFGFMLLQQKKVK